MVEKVLILLTFSQDASDFHVLFGSSLLISMAPLSNEIRPITSFMPPHIGPAIPEVDD